MCLRRVLGARPPASTRVRRVTVLSPDTASCHPGEHLNLPVDACPSDGKRRSRVATVRRIVDETWGLWSIAWGGSIPGTNIVAKVDNQPARSVFLSGFIDLDGGSAVVPDTDGPLPFMQRPFTLGPDSSIAGWSDFARTMPLFNFRLAGSGTVAMTAQRVGTSSIFDVQSLAWVFNAAPVAPTPEPGSTVLLLTGLGGLAIIWRRRTVSA